MFDKMGKIIIKLLVLTICIISVPATTVFAAENTTNSTQTTGAGASVNLGDTTASTFESISVDKETGTSGEKITVTVEASDDISGIDSIYVSFDAPSGSAAKYVSLRENSEGKYTGTITIGPNDAVGVWRVSFIELKDNASNSRNICNTEVFTSAGSENNILEDLSAGDFGVNGTISDTTEPVLNSINVDKQNVAKGEKITVTADASDDISGIKSITVFYKAPAGSAIKFVELSKNAEGKYTGTMTIGLNDAVGVWKVSFIDIEDNASNSRNICNTEVFTSAGFENNILEDLSTGDFEVNGTISDTTEPVLNSINVDKQTVPKGEKITVTADASDDISGIKSITVFYKAPAGSAIKFVELSKNAEGKYTGTMTIGLNDAVGVWKVSFIDIEDNASNSRNICNTEVFTSAGFENNILEDLSSGDFEVNSTVLDPEITPPTGEPTEEVAMPTSIRILGTEKVDNTLSAEIIRNNTEFIVDPSANVIYEWFRLDNRYSENGALVGRDKTYSLNSNDLGKYIKLVVYYNNKKVDEDITSKIVNKTSSGGSSSGGSGSSSGSSSSSSSDSNNTSTSNNNNSSDNNNNSTASNTSVSTPTVIKTVQIEKSDAGIVKLMNENGQAVTGWQLIDQKWYLANSTGVAQTGWQQQNGTWYLLNTDGVMQTGWQQVSGVWYLLKDNGSMATGWQQTNGKWYYLYSDGSMASNTVIDGYRVNESGAWV